jgi:gamma-glutamylaminecyclotransferase
MHEVFVFGTLKRGFPNHEPLLRGIECLGEWITLERYPLLVAGRWFSPVMLPEPGIGERVTGELYVVDDAKLAELDRLESTHLPDGYRRRTIDIACCRTGRRGRAEVYMKERHLVTLVHSGYLARYDDRRYVPQALRPKA